MKAQILLLTLALTTALLRAEKVAAPTPLRIEPAPDAPVAVTIPAGAEVALVDNTRLPPDLLPLPPDWIAVEYEDTYQGYVSNNQVLKDLSVESGAGILIEASAEAPLLAVTEDGDEIDIVEVDAGWTRVRIRKAIVGYVLDDSGGLFENTPLPAPKAATAAAATPAADAPLPPVTAPPKDPGLTPISMTGRLERTRRLFGRGPAQDYQLIDANGMVLAYLDTASLLTTEPVDSFLGLVVDVSGVPSRPEKSKVIVIGVESLRLQRPF